MNIKTLFLSIALALTAPMISMTAQADILSIGSNAKVLTKSNTPKHGETMQRVAKKYGTAKRTSTAKGPITKLNPKITRWDYANFTVFFENSHVIHSVVRR